MVQGYEELAHQHVLLLPEVLPKQNKMAPFRSAARPRDYTHTLFLLSKQKNQARQSD
jgi:hypothetical protein